MQEGFAEFYVLSKLLAQQSSELHLLKSYLIFQLENLTSKSRANNAKKAGKILFFLAVLAFKNSYINGKILINDFEPL